MKKIYALAFLAVAFSVVASVVARAGVCVGSCGTDGADGVVTLPPNGAQYEWVSTFGGIVGVGGAPGVPADFTDGSTFQTSVFFVSTGAQLVGYYNYVTTDGNGFPDSAYSELYTSGGTPVALLFSAQTTPSGNTVPGYTVTGGPGVNATLTPASVDLGTQSGPVWSPLGASSGMCFTAPGCGYSGWVTSDYTVAAGGSYYIQFGVANANDEGYDSGLAVALQPPVPEPGTLMLLGTGLLALLARRFRHA